MEDFANVPLTGEPDETSPPGLKEAVTPSITESVTDAPPITETAPEISPPPGADAPPSPVPGEGFGADPQAVQETDAPPDTEGVTETPSDAERATDALEFKLTETASTYPSKSPPSGETSPESSVPPPLKGEGDRGRGLSLPQTPSDTETAPEMSDAPSDTQAVQETDAPSDAAPIVPDAPETPPDTQSVHETPSRAKPPRQKRSRRWLWGFLCGLALAGALAVCARVWEQRRAASDNDRFAWDFRDDFQETESRQDLAIKIPVWPLGDGPAFTLLREHGDAQSAQEIYRNANPSVVTVIVELNSDSAAVGTGVIFSDDGYFVTNYHVVQGGTQCRAMLDSGRAYPALFVAGDERNDLAILKMDASGPFPAAQFGDSERLTVGDPVYAIGNPLGVEFRGTLTNGIISAIDRDVLVDGRTMTLLQTNAALNSGNSGGPLINEYGQVIGINVVKMSSRRSTVEGLGFAIPSAFMERLVNDLLTYGESQPEPTIGVSVDSFGTEVEPDLWGICVLKVEPHSAAEAGGVKVDDYIIAADGETISGSRDLLRVRRRYHVGESMSLTLWRDGERVDAVITFTE